MRIRLLKPHVAIVIALGLAACGPAEQPGVGKTGMDEESFTEEAQQAAALITPEWLRPHIKRLSSDELGGRGPASTGDETARLYIADVLKGLGFEPGAEDGSWQQPFDLVGITADVPDTWVFRGGREELSLARWDEFIAGSGMQADRSTIADAELVFVGYGIEAPEYSWNDFKGTDLRGKVLLMLNNDPDWDPALFEGETRLYYGRWDYKYESAARQGAVGAIIIHTQPSAGYPWQVVQTSWTGEQFELPAAGEPRLQVASWVTHDAAVRLVDLGGQDLDALVQAARSPDFEPVPLGIQTSITFSNALSSVRTANVLGLLPGADPTLRDEVVIYTAHHDHLGIGEPDAEGDRIYNGAVDNAAGVAQVLAIAKALAALPERPRRSILMLLVGAEEQGLLGSAYYAAHPTFPPGKIAANINYDGGNIWGKTRDLTFIGLGKSTLDEVVRAVAGRQNRVVKPDQFPDRGYFYRSDQFNLAKIGVPALYLDTGTDFVDRPPEWGKQQIEAYEANQYHQPSDEPDDSWNFDGMLDDARLGFWVGLIVANADQMPAWNPGDEFEAARKEAISRTN